MLCYADKRPADATSRSTGASSSSSPLPHGGSTLINSTDPFYKEFRDLPYYISIQRLQHYARDAHKEYADLKVRKCFTLMLTSLCEQPRSTLTLAGLC